MSLPPLSMRWFTEPIDITWGYQHALRCVITAGSVFLFREIVWSHFYIQKPMAMVWKDLSYNLEGYFRGVKYLHMVANRITYETNIRGS